jgi:hypothetical protein
MDNSGQHGIKTTKHIGPLDTSDQPPFLFAVITYKMTTARARFGYTFCIRLSAHLFNH